MLQYDYPVLSYVLCLAHSVIVVVVVAVIGEQETV
jgi:hypothetical protein